MSIVDKIDILKGHISESYNALEVKGATIPDEKNTNNLVDTINSLSSSANAVSIDRFIGAAKMSEVGVKWINCDGNGMAEPCILEEGEPIPRGMGNMKLCSALTGATIYEAESIDWENDFWFPIMILNVARTNNFFEAQEPSMKKYGCIHYDDRNNQYEFCMMNSFGENAKKSELESTEQYLITKEPSLFFSDTPIFGGFHSSPTIIEWSALAVRSPILRPDPITSDFKCCSVSMELPTHDVCCPINMNEETISELEERYSDVYYQNGNFAYESGSEKLGICLQSAQINESQLFLNINDALREEIIWN